MHHIVLQGSGKGLIVDAVMAVEPFVFSINQCCPEIGAYLVVADWHAVFAEELANQFAVGTVYLGCLGWVRVTHIAHRG